MGRNTGAYLEPSSYIEEYSIGADVALNDHRPDYVQNGVTALRRNTQTLLKSTEHDDLTAVERINSYFSRNDHLLAWYDLSSTLDRPLPRDGVVEWLAHASNRDIEIFCRWSLERTLDLTNALRRDRQQLDSHALKKTEKLVNTGMFPRFATAVTEKALQHYKLQGIDAFHSGGIPCAGFCNDHTIGLANLYDNRVSLRTPSTMMKQVVFHEDMHAAGRDRGFFRGISTFTPTLRFIEEAFVEHATEVAHTRFFKRPRIIDPRQRRHLLFSTGIYVPERTLLATVCDQTRISVEQLGEAYFSPRGDEYGERTRADIERKIGKYFGSSEHFFAFTKEYEDADSIGRNKLIQNTLEQPEQNI